MESYEQYMELQERQNNEEQDNVTSTIPPADIVAFNELRSCADLKRMCDKCQIDLDPDFQRGEVWKNRAQTLFVDSLMKQLPIPSMCVSLDLHTNKRYVIDGLQRITTINKFLSDDNWTLSKIDDVDERISGKKVGEIKKTYPNLYDLIENVTIPITIIRCDYTKNDHMQYLFQIFYRLNSGGNKLYNQEIRNCIYQGSFNTLLKNLAVSDGWLAFSKATPQKVKESRFSHEERILRFFAFYNNYENYKGKFASFLNDYMRDHVNITEQEEVEYRDLLENTLDIANKIENFTTSKNAAEAILVGIAKNLQQLKDLDDISLSFLYQKTIDLPEFAEEALKDGLGAQEKVKSRIANAIETFSRD